MAGLPCSVAQYLAAQKPAAREHTTTQLADRTQSGHTLWTNTFAKQVGYQTINRHRTGACRCETDPTEHQQRISNTRGARILTLDIERLPGHATGTHRGLTISGPFWDLNSWKSVIGYRIPYAWVTEWPRNICFAARWYGTRKPIFCSEWADGPDTMHQAAWDLYNEADIIVGHNLDNFDTKKLLNAWIELGLGEPRPYKTVDTLKVARRAGFESNTLDALCVRLGVQGKVDKYDPTVASDACAGNKAAQQKLRAYNIGDVEATEYLYDRFRPYIKNHPMMGSVGEGLVCSRCGGEMVLQPTKYRAQKIDYQLYKCADCGGHMRGGWHSRAMTLSAV